MDKFILSASVQHNVFSDIRRLLYTQWRYDASKQLIADGEIVRFGFLSDTWRGLMASQKFMHSKYFYNEKGDAIFREIMECPEYYVTRCELDIFQEQSIVMAESVISQLPEFDVVELGAGDATKSIYLLKALLDKQVRFTYYPIDISESVIKDLETKLPVLLPGLKVKGLNGDYFEMLEKLSGRRKLVLFLGSNIGNISIEATSDFLYDLSKDLLPGDLLLVGFDLKKDPKIILDAYNDKAGITRRFNLNLLQRINDELGADFDLDKFEHCPVYDEPTGACESYLVSKEAQTIKIGVNGRVHFKEGERIFMEVSQKYSEEQIEEFVGEGVLKPVHDFYDSKHWFLDKLWKKV